MVLYLTDQTTVEEIDKAHSAGLVGVKYYPAGATTNSHHGVTDIHQCYDVLQALSDYNMMLCIHSEVTDAEVDIFDRETVFIEQILKPLVRDFPNLKITMEHISTKQAVDYILNEAPDRVKASITCHHLLYNRNRTSKIKSNKMAVHPASVYIFALGSSYSKRSVLSLFACLPVHAGCDAARYVGGRYSSTSVLLTNSQGGGTSICLTAGGDVWIPQILFGY